MKSLILASTLSMTMLLGCADSGSSSSRVVGGPSNINPDLSELSKLQEGIYNSHLDICYATNLYAPFYKLSFGYVNKEFIAMRYEYLDAQCTQDHFIQSEVFSFKEGSSEMITFSLIDLQFLPLHQALVNDLNSNLSFGFNDWNTSMVKSVIDLPAQIGGPIVYKSGTLKVIKLKIVSGTNSVLINNVQYNKQ